MRGLIKLLAALWVFVAAPIRGSRRGQLTSREVERSLAVGGLSLVGLLGVLYGLQEVAPQLGALLGLTEDQAADVAAALGAIITLVQLVMRYFQKKDPTPHPEPDLEPGPMPEPKPEPGPALIAPAPLRLAAVAADSAPRPTPPALQRAAMDVAYAMVPVGANRDGYARSLGMDWVALLTLLVPVIRTVLQECRRPPEELITLAGEAAGPTAAAIRPVVRRLVLDQYVIPLLAGLLYRRAIERTTDEVVIGLLKAAAASSPTRMAAVLEAVKGEA